MQEPFASMCIWFFSVRPSPRHTQEDSYVFRSYAVQPFFVPFRLIWIPWSVLLPCHPSFQISLVYRLLSPVRRCASGHHRVRRRTVMNRDLPGVLYGLAVDCQYVLPHVFPFPLRGGLPILPLPRPGQCLSPFLPYLSR